MVACCVPLPDGYKEAGRGVFRLSSEIAELQKQLSYALHGLGDNNDMMNSLLHCSFLVIPAQVRLFSN